MTPLELLKELFANLGSTGIVAVIKRVWTRRKGKGDKASATIGETTPALRIAEYSGPPAPQRPSKYVQIRDESVLNPLYLVAAYKETPPLQRQAFVGQLESLRVGREGKLRSISHGDGNHYIIQVTDEAEWRSGGPVLTATIVPEEYPGFVLLREGDPITIIGTVKEVDEMRIRLGSKPDLFF